MKNAEVQNFQQKKWKRDNNSLTCIEDDDPTLVIFDVVNCGKNIIGATHQKTAVFGMTWHILCGALATLIGHAICQ